MIATEPRRHFLPVQGVPTPVPPTFEINGTCYMRTTSTGSLLLGVHDKLSGAWVQVRLFEDLDQASLERSGADTTLVAPYTLSNIGVSGMETHHISMSLLSCVLRHQLTFVYLSKISTPS